MTHFRSHIHRAISLSGTQRKLAEKTGCCQQNISLLLNKAGRVSAEMAVAIEHATAGAVTRNELRPDLFGASRCDAASLEERT